MVRSDEAKLLRFLRLCADLAGKCLFALFWGSFGDWEYNMGRSNERILTVRVFISVPLHENQLTSEAVRVYMRTDRQTEGRTYAARENDFIICPMLCYSYGTDKKKRKGKQNIPCK